MRAFLLFAIAVFGFADDPISLWPNLDIGIEPDTTTAKDALVAGRRVIRLGNVTNPQITLFRPAKGKDDGPAVLVFPAG